MTLPSALFIGTDKSGSTWLANRLAEHPDVCLPTAKDIGYFSDDRLFLRGAEWYEAQFRCGDRRTAVEVAHDYLASRAAAPRALDLLGPSISLIACLRPVGDRAVSAYWNARRHGLIKHSFADATRLYPFLTLGLHYHEHLLRWSSIFDRAPLVLDFEALRRGEHEQLWVETQSFLGVDVRPLPSGAQQPVRASAQARIPMLARGGKRLAIAMRSAGLTNALGALKRNAAVDRLFYTPLREELTPEDLAVAADLNARGLETAALVDSTYGTSLEASWQREKGTTR